MRHAYLIALAGLAACEQPTAAPKAAAPAATVAKAGPATIYGCLDGKTLRAAYPDSDTAVLMVEGRKLTLKVARSGSGARYVGEGVQWWTKGMTEGTLSVLKAGEDVADAEGVYCSTTPLPAVEPPAPGAPGGLPDDRTPISEAPFTPTSAQGAANVVQTYYAHIGEKDYAAAWKLWRGGGAASNQTQAEFAQGFARYAAYNAQVGAPGLTDGAAGSLYIEVPVVIYGRMMNGAELHQSGKVILKRINDVPGSTAQERLWGISQIELKP
ncbi:MliC family protein [Phenylobacterium immobile]|uniref:MliC family protein n=1 Tax=Phenylobacterium immobile TaxID=21 RepID=UPI000AAF4A1B|nr:MliC family protein [Phenylobacterium immobile]